ncbi:MAG: hypothetical protein ACM30G_19200 [Micromonosporaceae bacterium]
MGTSVDAGERPPTPAKPPYRFIVAIGVVVLTLIAMAVVAAIYPERAPTAAAGATTTPPPRVVAPTTPAGRPGPPPATGPLPSHVPPWPGAVTGTYAVVHTDTELGGRFEVRISLLNSATVAQPWVVTLAYPQPVTAIVSAWTVPGRQPPVLATNRPAFTLAGDQPIPARTSIELWLQLTVEPGGGIEATQCRVNDTPCER